MIENQIIKPIFIIGVPRSGTGLLYRMLCKHPDLAWFSHEDLQFLFSKKRQEKLKKRYTKMKENNEKIPRNEQSLSVFGLEQEDPLEGASKIPVEYETFWINCFGRDYITDVSEDKKNEIKQTIQKFLEKEKKIRFLNKSPNNSKRLFVLKKIFPDAKFINIGRDPRSVISSMLTRLELEGRFIVRIPIKNKTFRKINSLKQKFLLKIKKIDAVDNYSNAYKQITENMHEFSIQYHDNFINIIYEELLAEPEKTVTKILEFCELKKPSNLKDLIPKIKKTQNKWEEKLTRRDEQKIFKIVKSSIKKMNYPYDLSPVNNKVGINN